MELKILRTAAKLTQKELADRVGVDDSLISRVESGKQDIRTVAYRSVVRIARDGFGVRPDDVWPVEPFTPGSAEEVTGA